MKAINFKLIIIIILIMIKTTLTQSKIVSAEIVALDTIVVEFEQQLNKIFQENFRISNGLVIKSISREGNKILLNTSEIDLSEIYHLEVDGFGKIKIEPGRVLDKFYSDKKLGYVVSDGKTEFNLFAPRASLVKLVIFDHPADETGEEYFMSKDKDGVWSISIPNELWGKYYAYRVKGPQDKTELFDFDILIADPYSTAVAVKNSYEHEARTLICKNDFDWEGIEGPKIDQAKLIIYETHLRDLTAHPTAGAKSPGTYKGFVERGIRGGINYIKELGVNAVEFLPLHEFANWEIPFEKEYRGYYNTWNPYERNHWGYMSSFFFAPETYYASDGKITMGHWNGLDNKAVIEFKEVVKQLHKEGIAVILDVVYNHTSEYDYNAFKFIDKKYYYRLNSKQEFTSLSGCGNDFKTERPMARKLILESVKYWMTEYKIDGFRFDLAQLIDKETCKLILEEARKINPNVIIIAEPWGGGYDPEGFSKIDWAAWNDRARNGIKGQNPETRPGFIFGRWDEGVNTEMMKNFFGGTLLKKGGLFQKTSHSINYLESHDDHTLGDFVRIAIKKVSPHKVITDQKKAITLTKEEMKIHKLAALILFSLQGPVMIHSGQEFARAKIIANTNVPDTNIGMIDHNSYNKDNETNYINYEHVNWNKELFEYYKGLIALRKAHPQLSSFTYDELEFLSDNKNPFGVGYFLNPIDYKPIVVYCNGSRDLTSEIELPHGDWVVLADNNKVYSKKDKPKIITNRLKLNPTEGIILIRK